MSFLKATVTVGGMTFLSRILGFIRDILMAAVLGSGMLADIFFVALRFPNLFRALLAEGAFSVAFIPQYTEIDEKQGREKALQFASKALSVLCLSLFILCSVIMVFMPVFLYVIAPGFYDDPIKLAQTIELSRITFPYLLFMSIVALMGGVMQAHDKFMPFAAAPILFNACFIIALVFLPDAGETKAHTLAWTVLTAGIVQLAFMSFYLIKYKLQIKLTAPKIDEDIKRLLRKMGPAFVGSGVTQISVLLNTLLASLFPVGAVSYIYYSDRLTHLPVGVIGIAVGTALLPMLTRALVGKRDEEARNLFSFALLFSLALSLPAAVALFVAGHPIISVLFERGAFTPEAALETTRIMAAYAFSLPAMILWVVYTRIFFALSDTKTPMKISAWTTLYDVLASVFLAYYFGLIGIALGTLVASWIRIYQFSRAAQRIPAAKVTDGFYKRAGMIGLSSLVLAVYLFGAAKLLNDFLYSNHLFMEVVSLMILVIGGIVVYAISVVMTKAITVSEIKNVLRKKVE